jgi:MSHA biogenesis protein MshI
MAHPGWRFFPRRRRAPTGVATLSLSPTRVALLVRSGDGASMAAFERVGVDDPHRALQALVKEAGAEGMAVEWVLDVGAYSLLQVEKPPVPPAEWIAALRWKVRDLIGFPVEEAVMDAFEVPGLDSRGRPPTLYLAVARKDALRPHLVAIEAAGLRMARIAIAELAWAEAVRRLSPGDDSQAALILDAHGGSMLALREGLLFVARRFEFDADDRRLLDDVASADKARLFERIALELQRTLDYFDRTHQRPPPRRLLVLCGLEGLEGLSDALRGMLGLEIAEAPLETTWPALAPFAAAARARLAGLAAISGGAAP